MSKAQFRRLTIETVRPEALPHVLLEEDSRILLVVHRISCARTTTASGPGPYVRKRGRRNRPAEGGRTCTHSTDITPAMARRISLAAWAMAAFGTVAGELHALARINSHPDDLASSAHPCLGRARDGRRAAAARLVRPVLRLLDLRQDLAADLPRVRRGGLPGLPAPPAERRREVGLAGPTRGLRDPDAVGDRRLLHAVDRAVLRRRTGAFALIAFGGAVLGIMLLRKGFRPRTSRPGC